MKQKIKMQNWIPSGVLALILAGSTSTAFGVLTDLIVDDFSEGNVGNVETTVTGPSGNMVNDAIVTYDGTVGKPAGSCYVTLDWPPSNGGNWEDCKISWDWYPGSDVTIYESVDFDLKVDTAHSTLFSDGTYGAVSVIFQSWFTAGGGWSGLPGSAAIQNTTAWQHFSFPLGTVLPVPYQLNRLNISFFSNPPENALGPVSVWIDNVTIKAPPAYIPPPTLGSVTNVPLPVNKAIPGLNVLEVTEGNSYYDRQSLELMTNSGLSWVGRASVANPVSYSFSIVGYPNSANCEAYMFLVPNAGGNEGGADWNEANVVCVSLQGTPSSATMHFQYKVNEPNQNAMYGGGTEARGSYTNTPGSWNGVTPNYLESGNLGSVTNNFSGVFGTWTVTFTSPSNVTLTVQNGANSSSSTCIIPAYNTSYFAESSGFNVYIGMQANQADGMNQPVVFGNFAVTGVPSHWSENFQAETVLDSTNVWRYECSQSRAAIIVPATGADWVNWTIPDTGFSALVGPTVNIDANGWNGLSGSIVPLWGGREQLANSSDLPAGNMAFFCMIQRTFTKLQILLPGMTATPGVSPGYTGTPSNQLADGYGDYAFNTIVNGVDNNWNVVSGATDNIQLSSSGPSLLIQNGGETGELALAGGTVTFSVSFLTDEPGSAQLTATDVDDATKTAATSPTVLINQ